jgi:hypothetical protein
MFGERGVASCDVGQLFKPPKGSSDQAPAMQTKLGTYMSGHGHGLGMSTDMVCDMIRPEGMSRPVGTAMQTKPGTDMICDMIRSEGMSRPEGTAMQTKPGTDMISDMIRPGHGHNRPEMTKRTWPRAASTARIRDESAFVPKGRDTPAL